MWYHFICFFVFMCAHLILVSGRMFFCISECFYDLANHRTDLVFFLVELCSKERVNRLFITLIPKVLNNFFLFVGLTTLGTFYEFLLWNWLIHKIECSNVSTNNCNLQKREFCVSSLWIYINLSAIVLSLTILNYFANVCLKLKIHKLGRGGGLILLLQPSL